MNRLLRECNKVLLKERFVVVPWLTNADTNVVARKALAELRKVEKNDEGGRQIPREVKRWFDMFSEYNMRVLETMTGMEWVPTDIADTANEDSIGVYYNCSDTGYVGDMVCSCTCSLHAERASFRVTVPSSYALIVYHSPCLTFYRVNIEENRHTFFGLKYKNIYFDPCDASLIETEDVATMIDVVLNLIQEEEDDEMRCSACMLEMKDPLFEFLDAIKIDEPGVW